MSSDDLIKTKKLILPEWIEEDIDGFYQKLGARKLDYRQYLIHEMHLKRFMKEISARGKLQEEKKQEENADESSSDDDAPIHRFQNRQVDDDEESTSADDAPIRPSKPLSVDDVEDSSSSGYSAESSRYTDSDYHSTSYEDNDSGESDYINASD